MKLNTKKIYLMDSVLIVAVVLLSVIANIFSLGFYSDDWGMLSNFVLSKDQSILGLFQAATTPNTQMRPVMNFYDSLLFYFFNAQPLGYHVVNSLLMALVGLMIYVNLVKFKLPRIIALTISIIYVLLPNYSSDRFWFATFQSHFSMLFYLVNTYSGFKFLNSQNKMKLFWLFLFVISIFFCGLSYEVVLPLFLINIYLYLTIFNNDKRIRKYIFFLSFLIVFSIMLVFLYKLLTSIRLGLPPLIHMPGYAIGIYFNAFLTNFYFWLLKLPFIWVTILYKYFSITNVLLSLITFFVVFLYFINVKSNDFSLILKKYPKKLLVSGLIYFVFGYAIFLTNSNVGFSPTGLDNRVAIASSLGLSIFLTGSIAYLLNKLPLKNKYIFYCLILSVFAAGNLLIINTIGDYWSKAHVKTKSIILNLQTQKITLPSQSTILFDGICSYEGPAPVIEARWDARGIVQYVYKDKTLYGDVVNNLIDYSENGVMTKIYNFTNLYSYEKLYIYNYQLNRIVKISNYNEAKTYFEKIARTENLKCPVEKDGQGVILF